MIKAILMDVDGTLTDGKKYYFGDKIAKSFSVIDGQGIELAHEAGLICGIITADENWTEIYDRADHLGIKFVRTTEDKLAALADFCNEYTITFDEVCYIGDDIKDIPVLKEVGLPACPNTANPTISDYIRQRYGFISMYSGGNGAVRDTIEWVIKRNK